MPAICTVQSQVLHLQHTCSSSHRIGYKSITFDNFFMSNQEVPPVWESYIHQIVNSSSISFFFWNSWFLPLPLRMVPLPLFHSFLVFPFWKNLKKIWHTPGSVNFDFLFVLIISIKCLLLFCHYFWDIWCSLSGASLSQRVSASSLRDSRFLDVAIWKIKL